MDPIRLLLYVVTSKSISHRLSSFGGTMPADRQLVLVVCPVV